MLWRKRQTIYNAYSVCQVILLWIEKKKKLNFVFTYQTTFASDVLSGDRQGKIPCDTSIRSTYSTRAKAQSWGADVQWSFLELCFIVFIGILNFCMYIYTKKNFNCQNLHYSETLLSRIVQHSFVCAVWICSPLYSNAYGSAVLPKLRGCSTQQKMIC